MKQYAYRLTGLSGHYDQRSDNKDKLIEEATSRIGLFTLWQWSGDRWRNAGPYLFSHGQTVSL